MTANVLISYLFIDGECLNATLGKIGERYHLGVTPSLDLTRVRAQHRKVFHYDAIPVQRPDEDDNAHSIRWRRSARSLRESRGRPGITFALAKLISVANAETNKKWSTYTLRSMRC